MKPEKRSPASPRRVWGTLRFRISALTTLAVVVVLGVAGMGVVALQRRVLLDDLEDSLRTEAAELESIADAASPPPDLPGLGDDVSGQIVSGDGSVLASTTELEGEPPLVGAVSEGELLTTREELPGADEDVPCLILARSAGSGGPTVLVAAPLDDVMESTAALTKALAITIPLVAAALAGLVWWMIGRTLRPVEDITAEVATIDGSELRRRVPEPAGQDEIARLARTMNSMLDRIESASVMQQRFVADASHELRGPLTRMRSELEVHTAHPDGADVSATLKSLTEEVEGMQRLVDDLLALATADAGAPPGTRGPVDLDDIVLRQGRRIRRSGRVELDVSGVSAAQLQGDVDQLARAVRNLCDNAVRHASSKVTITLREACGSAVLTVADDGPGVGPGDRERVFERFTRLDDARTREEGGAGLGLAITREIVERHHGTVVIDPDWSPGTRFVVTIPVDALA